MMTLATQKTDANIFFGISSPDLFYCLDLLFWLSIVMNSGFILCHKSVESILRVSLEQLQTDAGYCEPNSLNLEI